MTPEEAEAKFADRDARCPCPECKGKREIQEAIDAATKPLREEVERLKGMTPQDVRYGRDNHASITMGELVALVLKETEQEAFLDALDREFLVGCWGSVLKEYPDRNLLRDLRGFIRGAVWKERQRAEASNRALVEALRAFETFYSRCAQLLDGWHADGTAWTEWDESVRKELTALGSQARAALAVHEERSKPPQPQPEREP